MDPNEKDRLDVFDQLLVKTGILKEDDAAVLLDMGYLKAPASKGHHGAYDGGLFNHSYEVTTKLQWLTKYLGLKWSRIHSPIIVGMFHDLCKLDNYIKIGKDWEYNPNVILNGHGEKSVIIAQQFVKLTQEEIACIRWHMGAFDSKENWQYYTRAIGEYPNVLYTHTADMIASQIFMV